MMTRRVSLWITAALAMAIAATALMIGLALVAQAGPSPADITLAGITARGAD